MIICYNSRGFFNLIMTVIFPYDFLIFFKGWNLACLLLNV